MTRPTLLALALALALATGAAHAAAPTTDDQKTLYTLGQIIARQTSVFQLTPAELEMVQQGWRDAAQGKSAVDLQVYGPKVDELAQTRQAAAAKEQSAKGKEVIAKAAAEKGAVKAPGGFVYLPLVEGKGAKPAATDTVRVHYRGTLPNGTEFDSSHKRGEPTEFPLNGVIKCWSEGVAMMKVGGKARLTCPPETAYGERGAGGVIPPGATLVFEVELLGIKGK